ncbi:MAG TPA: hypothetical protein VMX94_10110 [Armatimonadota bacterium]|nr:hypothetical protein [Armatimonadota bacterium]
MDLASIAQRLEAGEGLKIKYRYPIQPSDCRSGPRCGIRTDKLLDVSVELGRFYTVFRGEVPIWLEADEVLEITPDDGVYMDFTEE